MTKGTAVIRLFLFAAYTWLGTSVSLAPATGGGLPLWDKSMHFTFYAIYVLLGSQLVRTPRHFHLLCLAIFAYSGCMEIGQHFVPGRSMSAMDMLANGLGVGLGMILAIQALPTLRKA
jgi:VanZ family protein